MDSERSPSFILRSKLYRPPLHGVHIRRQRLLEQLDQRSERPLTLISAPAGYGKTSLASSWLEASDSPCAWLSLGVTENDLRLFLSYFLAAIQNIFPNFGRQIQALVNAATLAPLTILADSLINEIDQIEQPYIIVMDDFHLIKDKSILDLMNRLLRHPPQLMHLVLICRRDPYLPITTLRAKRLLTEIRTQDLLFNKKEIKTLLTEMLGNQVDPSIATALAEKTEGWVTGLLLAVFSMRSQGRLNPALLEPQVDAQYVMEYLFSEVFSKQPPEITQYLMNSAILDRFCGPLCEAVWRPVAEPFADQIDGWGFIAWLKEKNLFLVPLDKESLWFRYHHLFQKLLRKQLNRHLSQGDINVLHTRASTWFAENGLIEEALKHALEGESLAAAAQLIGKHGFELLNDEQWPRLERWLRMLPGDVIDQYPELLVLASWLHVIYFRYTELVSCLNKAETLLTSRSVKEHIIGHINAIRTWQHNIVVKSEGSLACARLAFEKLPRNHRWARMFTFLDQAAAYQMIGNLGKAFATIEKAIGDPDLKNGMSQGFLHATPCYIYWMDADLPAMLQRATHSLKITKDYQTHAVIAHSLYFMSIAHYHRNELQIAEEKLVVVLKEPYNQHALNFIHSAFALALIHQARGRPDAANKVAESVVSYSLDTNNTAVMQITRAFQAELALRQGRLVEASHWAKQFAAKPFTIMHRFYVPQLTLVKVLLAQDTMDSREQATELLTQLYEFVINTHNARFQIDVQALQALLYNSQGKESAALEKLTKSLNIAEPGGFIRSFVDLGPGMADLLKRLQKQNVAVEYIESILAAFREDERVVVPEADDQPIASVHPPHRPPTVSQPPVEPLTNRELDVLEQLARRLSNKEIAEKLFISGETVKSHLTNIYQKLQVSKRREAVGKAKKAGIL